MSPCGPWLQRESTSMDGARIVAMCNLLCVYFRDDTVHVTKVKYPAEIGMYVETGVIGRIH